MNTQTLLQPALQVVQRQWYYAALGLLVLMAVCLLAAVFDERTLHGISVWTKPAKFALSIAVYYLTLMWFASYLTPDTLETTSGRILVGTSLVAGLAEMLYILVMAALGQASHFNFSSGFTTVMYSLMGVGATCMVLVLPWLGYLIARQNRLSQPMVFAIVSGLVLSCVLGGGFGGYLGGNGSHWVQAAQTDATGVWLFNWATDGGDLRVAHFFGLHAMQALPMFALLLPRTFSDHLKLTLVVAFATAYTAFTVSTFYQAVQGQPFIA